MFDVSLHQVVLVILDDRAEAVGEDRTYKRGKIHPPVKPLKRS